MNYLSNIFSYSFLLYIFCYKYLVTTTADQMALRRKYKINEEDLDQIPGKNRKRKKKRQSSGIREAPTGRSAGSGPNVKILDPDTYDHRICGICLAPMEAAFKHSKVKPVVPLVADAAEQLMLLETLMKAVPSSTTSITTSAPSSSSSSSSSETALTDPAATVHEVHTGNNENTAIEITFDCDIPEQLDTSESLSASQTNTATDSTAASSVTSTDIEVIDLTKGSTLSTSPTFFHRLVCVGCGVNVHLGCVHETGGMTSLCLTKGKYYFCSFCLLSCPFVSCKCVSTLVIKCPK